MQDRHIRATAQAGDTGGFYGHLREGVRGTTSVFQNIAERPIQDIKYKASTPTRAELVFLPNEKPTFTGNFRASLVQQGLAKIIRQTKAKQTAPQQALPVVLIYCPLLSDGNAGHLL